MRDVSMQAADLEEETDENIVEKCEELHLIAGSIAEREYAVRAFSSTNKLFSRWRNLHVYLTVFLFAMLTVHVLPSRLERRLRRDVPSMPRFLGRVPFETPDQIP